MAQKSEENFRQYAQAQGYDHLAFWGRPAEGVVPIFRYTGEKQNLRYLKEPYPNMDASAYWDRYPVLIRVLEQQPHCLEKVCWADSDIVILDSHQMLPTPRAGTVLVGAKALGWWPINTGFFCATPEALPLLREVVAYRHNPPPAGEPGETLARCNPLLCTHDQDAFKEVLDAHPEFAEQVQVIPPRASFRTDSEFTQKDLRPPGGLKGPLQSFVIVRPHEPDFACDPAEDYSCHCGVPPRFKPACVSSLLEQAEIREGAHHPSPPTSRVTALIFEKSSPISRSAPRRDQAIQAYCASDPSFTCRSFSTKGSPDWARVAALADYFQEVSPNETEWIAAFDSSLFPAHADSSLSSLLASAQKAHHLVALRSLDAFKKVGALVETPFLLARNSHTSRTLLSRLQHQWLARCSSADFYLEPSNAPSLDTLPCQGPSVDETLSRDALIGYLNPLHVLPLSYYDKDGKLVLIIQRVWGNSKADKRAILAKA